MSSLAEALRLGARIVELDVRLSSDGVAVVMHDATVDRTTDGSGAVHELDARALAALNAGTAESPEPPPTLAEVLDLASGRAAVALEIKNLPGEPGFESGRERAVEATHAELERTAFAGSVLIVSFNPASVAASKALDASVPTGFLSTDPIPAREALGFAAAAGHDLVLPGTRSLVPLGAPFVKDVHAAGLRVGTWTADEPAEVRTLLEWGVDAIASNDPAMALGVLAEQG